MSDESDHILSELSDFELPALEFEDDGGDDVGFDEVLVPSLAKKKRDILVEVDEGCKKVITLTDEEQNLKQLFRQAVKKDPAFRHYAQQPVVFQIFSEKFNTWVDVDENNTSDLNDGTHLKAIFRNNVDVKRIKHSKHKRKSKKSSSHDEHKKRKEKSYSSKRHNVPMDDGKEIYNSKRSRTAYSSDESQSLVTTTVIDEPYSSHYRAPDIQHTRTEGHCTVPYNLCSVSSTTYTVSSTNYVVSPTNYKIQVVDVSKSEAPNISEDEIEEGEMRDEDENEYEDEISKEIVPASQGEVYRLSLGLRGKNPISALHELCSRLRWGPPIFEMHEENYSSLNPQFLMKVTVKEKTYIPETPSRRKQTAKNVAAEFCLKHMGIFE